MVSRDCTRITPENPGRLSASGIAALRALTDAHEISIDRLTRLPKEFGDFKQIEIHIDGQSWTILISDEYDEYQQDRSLLGVFMALDALQEYGRSDDFLSWCDTFEVSPHLEKLRVYYSGLNKVYREVKEKLGGFESILSEIQFQFPWRDKDDAGALLNL